MTQLQHGRTLRGCIQGDAPAEAFFPQLFAYWREAVYQSRSSSATTSFPTSTARSLIR